MNQKIKFRTIKSYVKRNRHLTQTRLDAKNLLWPIYGLNSKQKILNFHRIFGNDNKIILEIGFGMGDSFFTMAATHQNYNFIGIEVHEPGIGELLNKLKLQPLSNIKIFSEDAVTVINAAIPDNSLHQILILFPDPWPKRRHIKRRLIQPEFIESIIPKLKREGYFYMVTDCEDYAKHVKGVMQHFQQFFQEEAKITALPINRLSTTKFEQRGIDLGHRIFDLIFMKK